MDKDFSSDVFTGKRIRLETIRGNSDERLLRCILMKPMICQQRFDEWLRFHGSSASCQIETARTGDLREGMNGGSRAQESCLVRSQASHRVTIGLGKSAVACYRHHFPLTMGHSFPENELYRACDLWDFMRQKTCVRKRSQSTVCPTSFPL